MSLNDRTDCLLIQPPFTAQGILPHAETHTVGEGLLSISAFLGSKGFSTEVFCIDELFLGVEGFSFGRKKLDPSDSEIISRIRLSNPRIVGVSALTPQYSHAINILNLCKKVNTEITTVIGGPHVTFLDKKVLADSRSVDIVVRGEGEWTMAELVEFILEHKSLDTVLGITFRQEDGQIVRNADRPMGDLTKLPAADYDKVNPNYMKECFYFLTFTRGCPFNCSYCVEGRFWGHRIRTRSIDAVMNEIRYLLKHYDNGILFLGSVFNFPEDFFINICNELKNVNLGNRSVSVLVSANYLPDEHLRLMKEAGVNKIMIAAESAAPEVLKRMNKHISFDLVVDRCKAARKFGLDIGTFWLFGHPGETEETARKSLDAMAYLWEKQLNDGQEIATFIPYPGLPIVNNPEKEGFRILTQDLSQYSRFDKPVIELTTIPYQRMCEIYEKACKIAQYWLSFYRELSGNDLTDVYQHIQRIHSKQ